MIELRKNGYPWWFDTLKQQIITLGLNYYNYYNAQVMVVKKCSFKTKLKEKRPRLIAIECVCHLVATAVKYSCAKIHNVEFAIKGLPKFLNASPKRTAVFCNIVEDLGEIFQKFPAMLILIDLFVIRVLLLFSVIGITLLFSGTCI